MLAVFENLHDMDIKRNWKTIRLIIKILVRESPCYYELKKQEPCFDEE